jgi:hypothetical protein
MTKDFYCPISRRRTHLCDIARLAWVAALLVTSAASAGRVSESDSANIHRIAVVASLGNTFRASFPGFTAFGNRVFDQPVPEWSIDTAATQDVISAIQQQGQFTAEALNTDNLNLPWLTDSPDRKYLPAKVSAALLAQARMEGADTLLVVMPAQNVHSNARPGFGLAGGQVFGKLYECVIASLGIFVLRVSDGHWLAREVSDPCVMKTTEFQLKDSWSEYSVLEQSALQQAVKEGVALQIDKTLDSLRLTKNSVPTVSRSAN